MNVFLSAVGEDRCRWYLALESQPLGHGADHRLYEITGVDEKTILRGRVELADSMADRPTDWVRNLAPDVLRLRNDLTTNDTLEDLVEPKTTPDDRPDLGTQQPAQAPIQDTLRPRVFLPST